MVNGQRLTLHLHLIVAGEVAFLDVLQLRPCELAAEALQMVGEDDAVEVIKFMLHDASQITRHPFIVLLELLILIGDTDALRTLHLLMDAGQGETSFLHDVGLRFVVLLDVGVDVGLDEAFVLGQVVADDVEVDDDDPDGTPHLRSCQADALAALQRFVHILYELLQLGIVFVYLLCFLTKHRLAVCIYR